MNTMNNMTDKEHIYHLWYLDDITLAEAEASGLFTPEEIDEMHADDCEYYGIESPY